MKVFLEGDIKEAGRILFENNPLSAITSIVCPHQKNCYGHCVLGMKGEGIEFYRVEQYVSNLYLDTITIPEIKKNGKKVAVVGSGPAGLTMSMIMASRGYEVTLFEEQSDIGGVLRYGIPGFRLGKELLGSYKKILIAMGVKLRFNINFGKIIDVEDLFFDGYKAVFLGIGVGRPNKLGLLGETLGHVHYAIDYLKDPRNFIIGKNVVVIGAGNVAIDASRTAIRRHNSNVLMINRADSDGITADKDELELAIMDGVQIRNNLQVVRILEDKVICIPTVKTENEDGSVTFEEDFSEQIEIPCDSVILAIGQGPSSEGTYGSLNLTNRGLIKVDGFGETSQKNVFAAGDIITGASTVVESVADTINTARHMLERLEKM